MKLFDSAVFLLGFGFGGLCISAESGQGKVDFEKRCGGCHTADTIKVGPKLRGIFGRPAGRDPGFPYSSALKAAQFSWDEPALNKWLTDPEDLVPDTDMAFRLSDKAERTRIIEYLKQLK
jgi:cytochrome c